MSFSAFIFFCIVCAGHAAGVATSSGVINADTNAMQMVNLESAEGKRVSGKGKRESGPSPTRGSNALRLSVLPDEVIDSVIAHHIPSLAALGALAATSSEMHKLIQPQIIPAAIRLEEALLQRRSGGADYRQFPHTIPTHVRWIPEGNTLGHQLTHYEVTGTASSGYTNELNLVHFRLTDNEVPLLAKHLLASGLLGEANTLSLESNQLSDVGLHALVKGLAGSELTKLKTINLKGNPEITLAGVQHLIDWSSWHAPALFYIVVPYDRSTSMRHREGFIPWINFIS